MSKGESAPFMARVGRHGRCIRRDVRCARVASRLRGWNPVLGLLTSLPLVGCGVGATIAVNRVVESGPISVLVVLALTLPLLSLVSRK